jgi:hypothetical protein
VKHTSTSPRSQTLSVGETAKRLDISTDSVRNYCERGWLQCIRARGNHRRILVRSIESFEAQRNPKRPERAETPQGLPQARRIEDEFEIYYLGNANYPNGVDPGYICNFSFFEAMLPGGLNTSTMLADVGRMFGGGTFKIVRVRDGEVISERVFSLPGPTKNDVVMMREVNLDS